MARWMKPIPMLGVAVAGGLLLGVALGAALNVPWTAARLHEPPPTARASRNTTRLAVAATRAARSAFVVDSVRRALESVAPGTVVATRDVPVDVVEAVHRAVSLARGTAAEALARPATRVVVVRDDAVLTLRDSLSRWEAERMLVTQAIPQQAGEPCLVIVRIGPRVGASRGARGNIALILRHGLPGLCAFASAFGVPGPGIADWLSRTGGSRGTEADWSAPTPPMMPDDDLVMTYGLFAGSTGRYGTLQCLGGNVDACEELVLESPGAWGVSALPRPQRREAMHAVGPIAEWDARVAGRFNWRLDGRFLADLIALRGEAAFREFWTSDLPVAEAFQTVYGERLGAWTVTWLRELRIELPRELRQRAAGIPGTLLLMALAVGGALLYASRRTVSGLG